MGTVQFLYIMYRIIRQRILLYVRSSVGTICSEPVHARDSINTSKCEYSSVERSGRLAARVCSMVRHGNKVEQ